MTTSAPHSTPSSSANNAAAPYGQFLNLMSQLYPTKEQAITQLVLDKTQLQMPKETELFISDIHGEYNSFSYILRTGCGKLKEALDACFDTDVTNDEKQALATLVCYPKEKLAFELSQEHASPKTPEEIVAWYKRTLIDLTCLGMFCCKDHTTARINAALDNAPQCYANTPQPYAPLIRQLLISLPEDTLSQTADAIIDSGCAPDVIEALAQFIQHLLVGKLHMLGDVYDRGPAPDNIMEELIAYHNLNIQWGNHDIVWMGAALGQWGCIAHVVRNCARYGNLDILTDAYGINLMPLITFALKAYQDDPCVAFGLKSNPGLSEEDLDIAIKVQKAMAILQFKVEAQLIDENPSFGLEERKLLHRINYQTNTVMLDGTEYPLKDTVFPTVDPQNPYALTPEEKQVMSALEHAFASCQKLQRHVALFLEKGSLYAIENNTLMFHACVPLNPDGSLMEVSLFEKTYKGRALFDAVDAYIRAAFETQNSQAKKQGLDLLWYLWLGAGSPLFAKSKMATFEIYLIEDKAARKEVKNAFYSLLEDEATLNGILEDFGLDPSNSRMVCGHVPVKIKDGEDPVKCGGKLIMIDGGFSSAYQKTTGIAGLTLVSNADGIYLAAHQPFVPKEEAVATNAAVQSSFRTIETYQKPLLTAQTSASAPVLQRVADLEALLTS